VPRLARPTQIAGDLRAFVDALHELHEQAGLPSLSDMERMIVVGVASRSRIHEAFSRPRLPSWPLIELLVEQLAGRVPRGPAPLDEVSRFHRLWLAASKQPVSRETPHVHGVRVDRGPAHFGMIGNSVAALAFNRMGWMYSEQAYGDGIDGLARPVDRRGHVAGRMLAVVVKSGRSYFREECDGTIIFRESASHVSHWLDHQVPVVLVLVDPDSEKAYWVHVSAASVTRSGDRWRLAVPADQLLDVSSSEELNLLTTAPSSST
jgi:hypothetical protein